MYLDSVTTTPNSGVIYLDLVTTFGLPVFLGGLVVKTMTTSVMPLHHSDNKLMEQARTVLVNTVIAVAYNNVS